MVAIDPEREIILPKNHSAYLILFWLRFTMNG